MTTAESIRAEAERRGGKPRRNRPAKAELWLQVAVKIEAWSQYRIDPDSRNPDPLDEIAKRYSLTEADMQRLLGQIANELENRALRAGYDEAWVDA